MDKKSERAEERPSTSLGTNDEEGRLSTLRQAQDDRDSEEVGWPRGSAARNDDEGERVVPGKNRPLQVARTGGRKLFDEARRSLFLEWFAATCNVKLSAERAGVNYKTVFKHRMNDERFAEAWDRALEQGVARLKAKLLETRARETPIGIDGDLDAPELEAVDPALAIQLLREHERRLAGYPKRGATPRVATNAEVREALVKRLAAFGVRVSEPPSASEGSKA
ncbi:hypothetical protein [Sphingosinicella humi]|uniref:hypothetical protein n=1 Tax=Allosphingosinicella humi TaxID=2068657 RepID=UPI0013048AAA|nr:hypothetical protein [Sphingosinicella humi]